MVAPLPVREYASIHDMKAAYLAIHRRTFAPRPVEVKPVLFQDQIKAIPEPDRDLTVAAAAEARTRFLEENRTERLDTLKILQAARIVAAVSGVSVAEIKGDRRWADHVKARQIAMYLACRTGRTGVSVGYYLGGRDHSTVFHARKLIRPVVKRLHLDRCRDAVEIAQRLWEADWAVSNEAAR